jgi:small-conductance mechanosensitive channel
VSESEAERSRSHEQTVRRLEAFSDIVIGFSLAQLGLSLVLPQHAIDFVQRPLGLIAFIVTFIVVARFWWTHFRLFRAFFEPNRVMIVCNFVALAALIVQVFTLQLYLYFVPKNEGLVAARIYFAYFALAYGALGCMFALGLWYRRSRLADAERRAGFRDAAGILCTVIGCTLGNIFSGDVDQTRFVVQVGHHRETFATAPTRIFVGAFAGWLVGRLIGALGPRLRSRLQARKAAPPADPSEPELTPAE